MVQRLEHTPPRNHPHSIPHFAFLGSGFDCGSMERDSGFVELVVGERVSERPCFPSCLCDPSSLPSQVVDVSLRPAF